MSTGTPPCCWSGRPTKRSAPKCRRWPISTAARAPRHHRHDPAPQQRRQRLGLSAHRPVRASALPAISTNLPADAGRARRAGSNFRSMSRRARRASATSARAFHTDLAGGFELVVGRDVEALRQFADIIRRTHLLCAGHRAGAGPGRRPADEPQLPAPRRCHHRGQPHHHGGQHVGPHAGAADRATSSTGWPWR